MKINEVTLPCGCVIWNETDDRGFYLKACPLGMDCKYVRYCVEESARQRKPTEVRHV